MSDEIQQGREVGEGCGMSEDQRKAVRRIEDEERKRILKEAFNEWCEAKFAQFGRWSFYSIAAAGIGLLAYAIFTHGGR